MYVSIRDHLLRAVGFDRLAEGLSYFGLDAVELAVERDGSLFSLTNDPPTLSVFSDADIARLQRQATQNGIRISALLLPSNFNAADIASELDWVVRTVEAAAQLGAPAVRIDAIMHGERELPLAERQTIFARGVRDVLERTAALSVDLGIENHGIQGNDPAFLEGLLAAVGSPRLGMTLDTGNFYWAGHPREQVYAILARLAPTAKHTHIKNIAYPENLRDIAREPGFEYGRYVSPIPEGDIDHSRVVRLLHEAGYARDLCIEDESLGRFDRPAQRRNLEAAAAHLNACIADGRK